MICSINECIPIIDIRLLHIIKYIRIYDQYWYTIFIILVLFDLKYI